MSTTSTQPQQDRRFYYFLAFIIIVAIVGTLLSQPAPGSVRQEIEAQYAKRTQGIMSKDIRPILDVLAPGFTQKYISGQATDRNAWEAGLQTRLDSMKADENRAKSNGGQWKNPESVSTVIQTITSSGNTATVSAVTKTTTSASYPGGLYYAATFEETSEDTWVRTAIGWRLQTTEQIRNRMTTDEMKSKHSPKTQPQIKK
jgi:hypothetical protein